MRSRPTRRMAATVVLAMMVAALPLLAAELPPGGTFLDDDQNVHEGYIEAIAAEGITRGCNPPTNDRYCPADEVTRGQMAAFLVRALDLPAGGPSPFTDDDDSVFEADISALAAAGITRGCNPPTNDNFCPDDPVDRGQMAAFLVRAFDYSDPGDGDLFVDDDGSIFEGDIDRLGTAGVTKGCNPPTNDRFCPDDSVLRDQMASFLGRALGLTPTTPPPRPTTTTTSTTTSSTSTTTSTSVPEDSALFEMSSVSFVPTSHTVSAPAEISWRNESGIAHNVTSSGGPWPFDVDVDMPSGADDLVIDLVTPGVYTFFCSIHVDFGMTGSVTVTG
jgi:plastocyanin